MLCASVPSRVPSTNADDDDVADDDDRAPVRSPSVCVHVGREARPVDLNESVYDR